MADVPGVMVAGGLDVGLVCHDNDAMRRFYGDTLGFSETLAFPLDAERELVMFGYGPSTLKLQCLKTPPPKGRGGIEVACGYRLLTIVVDDIDAVSARKETAGTSPVAAMSLDQLGFPRPDDGSLDNARIGFAFDPDGNLLELVDRADRPLGLDAVGLTVTDAAAAKRFWVDVVGGTDLGTTPIGPELTKRDVQVTGTVVKFWEQAPQPPLQTGPITDHVGIRYLTATVTDAPAVYDALVADGATPHSAPSELIPGITIGFVEDPDGNLLELVGA